MLIADDANGGDSGVAVVSDTFEDAGARAGASGVGASGAWMTTMGSCGNYGDSAGAILDDDSRHPLGPPRHIRRGNHSCSR